MAEKSLMVKLLLNASGFDTTLSRSTQLIKAFERNINDVGEGVSSFTEGLGLNISGLAKFGTIAGAAATAGKVLSDTFKRNETNCDSLDVALSQVTAGYNTFLDTINGGNWSNFFTNLNNAISGAKDLAESLDRLGSIKTNNSPLIAFNNNLIAQYRKLLQTGNLDKKQKEDLNERIRRLVKENERLQALEYNTGIETSRKGISNELFNRANSITPISQKDANKWANSILTGGLKFFDEQAKVMAELKKKGTVTTVRSSAGQFGNNTSYTTTDFDINSLSSNDRKRYALASAVTEGESSFKPYIELNAQSLDLNTAAIIQLTKQLKYGSGSKGSGSNGGDKSENTLKKLVEEFDKLVSNGLPLRDFNTGKLRTLALDGFKDLPNSIKAKLYPILENHYNTMKSLETLEHNGAITEQERAHKEQELVRGTRDKVIGISNDRIFLQEKNALEKVIVPALKEINFSANSATESEKVSQDFNAFYNKTIDKIKNNDKDKIMTVSPTSSLDADRVLDNLFKLEEEYIRLKLVADAYKETSNNLFDKTDANRISKDIDKVLKDINDAESSINKEKIKFLEKESWDVAKHGAYGTGKAIMSTTDSIIAMNKAWYSMDGWERFKSIISVIETLGSSVVGIIRMYEDWSKSIEAINAAKTVLQALETGEIVIMETGAASTIASNTALVASNKALTASYSETAAAGYMAAHSAIPFAGYAIGAGYTASAIATIKGAGTVGMFADGGIVQGTGSGWSDNIPTLLSNGEMVLNRRQQGNLFALLDGNRTSDISPVGDVNFKIQGKDLVGVIANYSKKQNKVL